MEWNNTHWVAVAIGVLGTLTLIFLLRRLALLFWTPPTQSVHFSPRGGCTDQVVAQLTQARREILVLAYGFTSRPIAEALVAAQKRGVRVEIILDHSNETEEYSHLSYLISEGLEPLIDAHHAIAHNKVMVIDRRTVITGSFNFTHQAEAENAENLLVLSHFGELVEAYRRNFAALKEQARPPQAKPHQPRSRSHTAAR
jgi:phosphatidylserine/phosphatidylglycerophosphate/cardiolipin synthase-like enzyme